MKTQETSINNTYTTEAALIVSNIYSKVVFLTTDGDVVYNGVCYRSTPKFEDLDEEFLTKLKEYLTNEDQEIA